MASNERLAAAQAIRREVLGAEAPDSAAEWSFAKPFLDLVTEHVYGAVWSRPGLGRRDRSLINLSMFAALNRPQELALHIGLALNHGVTPEEIREVFMQVAAYCGGPAGLTGFRAARQVFEKRGLTVAE